jgi:hypothetical protein
VMFNNEKYYLEATKEFESGSLDEALWAKAQSLTGGDEEKAKFEYIKLRSRSLLKNALADPKQLEVYYPYSNLVFIFIPLLIFSFEPPRRGLADFVLWFLVIGLLPFIISKIGSNIFKGEFEFSKEKWNVILSALYVFLMLVFMLQNAFSNL